MGREHEQRAERDEPAPLGALAGRPGEPVEGPAAVVLLPGLEAGEVGGAGRPVAETDVLAKLARNLDAAGLGGITDDLVTLVLEGGDFDVARLGALLRTPAEG